MADEPEKLADKSLLELTVEITLAHVCNNRPYTSEIAAFIEQIHGTLAALQGQPEGAGIDAPAVPIMDPKKSVKPDHIVCLECGKKSKTLKVHLRSQHGLTPETYRAKYGLGPDYPMIAKSFRDEARQRAIDLGLGDKMRAARSAARREKEISKAPANKRTHVALVGGK